MEENAKNIPSISKSTSAEGPFDYSFIHTIGRVALYDDLRSAPRITELPPAETTDYIESIASTVYTQSREAGGSIPYTVIREVSENFIHAQFQEIVVSILDGGNTIRFADSGPGISSKEKAQMPGFTSATEPMKRYIRGVGSGFPIVREFLEYAHGNITIEDNLESGAVVTVRIDTAERAGAQVQPSQPAETQAPPLQPAVDQAQGAAHGVGSADVAPLQPAANQVQGTPSATSVQPSPPQAQPLQFGQTAQIQGSYGTPPYNYGQPAVVYYGQPIVPGTQPVGASYPQPTVVSGVPVVVNPGAYPASAGASSPALSERESQFLHLLLTNGAMRITDFANLTGVSNSSIHATLKKLQESGLVEMVGKQRQLTPYGATVARSLH